MAVMQTPPVTAQNKDASSTGSRDARRSHQGSPPARVLVMENLHERSAFLESQLPAERCEVHVMDSARDALTWLQDAVHSRRRVGVDLLVCNARMLGDAGLELLARWCAFNPQVPVLLVSAFTNAKLRARMAAVPGGVVLDQDFSLEDVGATALSLVGENSLTS
jgi:DNA-binding response OmpR family regulator